jgi:16S rRNA (guanine527-N7)-methyltransferase
VKYLILDNILQQGAEALGLRLTLNQRNQFQEYYDLLKTWNKTVNLTSIEGEEEVAKKHFVDSLTYTKGFPSSFINLKFLDIGSGAGFPGVPLKIAFPELKITLLEPSFKRTSFLHHLNTKLNLGLWVIEDKAEPWLKHHPEFFDIMIMRAVGHADQFVDHIIGHLNSDGRIVISAGPRPIDFKNKKKHKTENLHFILPLTTNQRQLLIIYKS